MLAGSVSNTSCEMIANSSIERVACHMVTDLDSVIDVTVVCDESHKLKSSINMLVGYLVALKWKVAAKSQGSCMGETA
jgi:hypothetical protein